MTCLRSLTGCLSVLLAATAMGSCAAPRPDPPATPPAERQGSITPPAVVLFAEDTGDSSDYSIVMIHGSVDALAGRTLDVFPARDDSAGTKKLTVAAFLAADDDTGCVTPDRIRPSSEDDRLPDAGALLASIDINPNHRFTSREVRRSEREQLLATVLEGVNGVPASLRSMQTSNDALDIRVITDSIEPDLEFAVVMIDLQLPPPASTRHGESTVVRWFGLLESSRRSGWRRVALEQGEGCDGCDSQPDITRLRAFGDFDQDGRLDLLLKVSRYEGWSYRLMSKPAAEWVFQPALGDWGC